ncbi:heavy metal-responsive transcriptional regulator [Halothiobacillus sp. DCM-1]|uniref:heavy metal-responsive transcriptional regulator n=1 Tax=Halothiobacillus sp. DCM-1 TaxID=3112558 RepID=UPI00325319D9
MPRTAPDTLSIGRLARAAGLPTATLRYYERIGLITADQRSPANYRLYRPELLARLRFIRRAQTLGFHLQEIAELLSLHTRPDADSAAVKTIAEARLAEIEQKMTDLARMRAGLIELTQRCPGQGDIRHCPILAALDAEATA